MWRKLAIVLAIGVVLGVSTLWLVTMPATVPVSALGPYTPNLDNGRMMYVIGGCGSCHATPGQDDRALLGGGRVLHASSGNFYVPNISPDPTDGIGRWSEADFVTAMVKGTSPDGRHYYPPFPYPSYQGMKLDDLRDLFAYMKTLAPVQGRVPDHDLRFPYNIRRGIGVWKFLFLSNEPFKFNPSKSAEWNRGAYLSNGPGHCAECHSPRNRIGAVVTAQRYAGGPDPIDDGWVPNITQKSLKDWSQKDIAYLLETGSTPDGDSVGGTMTEVVRNTSRLSAEDRAAIAVYIKSLPPVEGPKPPEKK